MLCGALIASVAHVAAGHLSDVGWEPEGNRRGIIALGVAALLVSVVQLGSTFVIGFLFVLISQKIRSDAGWAGRRSASEAIALLSLGVSCVAIIERSPGGALSDGFGARR